MNNNSTQVIKVFKEGGIVIFPTDTAVGIGCRMDDENAVKKIFNIKNRELNNALLVLVDGVNMAQKYVQIPDDVRIKLIDKYWPGGLSIFLKTKRGTVPGIVTANSDVLAIRLPDHKDMQHVIHEVGVPIIATSANISGGETPYRIEDVNKKILTQVDYVLQGSCTYEKESTIVDTTVLPWRIIRQGVVKIDI